MKNLISVDDKLYTVNRIIKNLHEITVDQWKTYTHSEIAFRKDGLYYLCNLVSDVEIIVEEKPKYIQLELELN